MRVSYKWLQDYVDIPVGPEELAEKLTFAGVAVENIEYLGKAFDGVVVGLIEKLEKHPDADKLQICQINVGKEILQIVTGAPNVAEGQLVPVAVVGANLPGDFKIKKAKLRGIASSGMLCSAQELGIDPKSLPEDQQNGIMILSGDLLLGGDVKPILGLDDAILELELTPNRADCLSMIGVAREVAAIFGSEVKYPTIDFPELAEEIAGQVSVDIENSGLCRRYAGKLVKNVRIEPSPAWMRQRLQAAGVRPISNLVDVTNYVMLELGQPMHAFDFGTITEGRIIVRTAREGEKINSLDGVMRELTPEMLVIADALRPVAIAGVMGGLETEVTEQTTTILLEAAHFNGASIRRTSRGLGLRSESSSRFEKGIDVSGCVRAADRAAHLIHLLGAGEIVRGIVDSYPEPEDEKVIKLRLKRVNDILGTELGTQVVEDIIGRLQFGITAEASGDEWQVKVPLYRVDITREVDLIEEVVRLYGYNNIPITLPYGATTQGRKTHVQTVESLIKDTLAACGMNEAINLSFANPKSFDQLGLTENNPLRQNVKIQNPLSEEQSALRTTLIPGILETLNRNLSRRVKDLAIFEMGNVFHPREEEKLPLEQLILAGAVMGNSPANWLAKGDKMDFYFLKGVMEALFAALELKNYSFKAEAQAPIFHPGRTASVLVDGEAAGVIGEVHPSVLENYDLPGGVCVFDLNLGKLLEKVKLTKVYTSLPKYPGTERDVALVVKEEVPAQEIIDLIREQGGKLLKAVVPFDVYQGEQIAKGYKSLALSLKYQAADRTLTDEEIDGIQAKIAKALAKELGAELRQ